MCLSKGFLFPYAIFMSSDVKISGPKLLPPSMCSSAAAPQPRSDAKSKADDKKLSTDDPVPASSPSSVSQPDAHDLLKVLLSTSRRSEGPIVPKYVWQVGSGSIPSGGTLFNLTAIGQGTTDITRIGNNIRVKGVHLRFRINRDPVAGAAFGAIDTCSGVRFTLFRDRFPLTSIAGAVYGVSLSGISIVSQDFLFVDPGAGSAQTTTVAVRNPYTMERYHVYDDRVILPTTSIAASATNIFVGGGCYYDYHHKFDGGGFDMQFSGTGATTGCLNSLYFALNTDSTTTNNKLTYFYSTQLWFEDTA